MHPSLIQLSGGGKKPLPYPLQKYVLDEDCERFTRILAARYLVRDGPFFQLLKTPFAVCLFARVCRYHKTRSFLFRLYPSSLPPVYRRCWYVENTSQPLFLYPRSLLGDMIFISYVVRFRMTQK